MLLIRTAFKNIIGGGKRTWLNVVVLSFILVVMVAYNGIMDGWIEEARRDTEEWETGAGQYWYPGYDRYDQFTFQDAHGKLPAEMEKCVAHGTATPVLVLQASVYPQGRMHHVTLKGIDPGQQLVKIPSELLAGVPGEIPVLIGSRMARSAALREGDRVMLRWRDRHGVFDAREILVAGVFDTKVSGVDQGQVWIGLEDLYAMTGMQGEATYVILSGGCPAEKDTGGWEYKGLDFLLWDITLMERGGRIESALIFIILMAIALLAVFDTQTLSIFRRQKEIGTYIALGMTPYRVVGLFTLEGTAYSILAILAAVCWGTPLLYVFFLTGMPMPDSYSDLGVVVGDAIYPVYKISSMMIIIIVMVLLSALISFLPARKIARQRVVEALKGKIN